MHAKSVNDKIKDGVNWLRWCRLCAKEDEESNISVFCKEEQPTTTTGATTINTWIGNYANSDLSLAAAIGKYFWVNITRDEQLPKVLCTECFSLVTALVNFSERVTKVQQMFAVLLNSNNLDNLELRAIRQKYNLLDEEREHVLQQQRLPEVHYFEEKPKLTVYEEDELMHDIEDDGNPLESIVQNINIQKEYSTVENTEDVNEDQIYNEHENLGNDQMLEQLLSNEHEIHVNSNNDIVDTQSMENFQENGAKNFEIVVNYDVQQRIRPPRKSKTNRRSLENVYFEDGSSEETSNRKNTTYACNECPRKFKREQNFKVHQARKHGKKDSGNGIYPCTQCPRVFNRRCNLDRHSNVHLPLATRKIIPCPYCEKKFISNSLVQSHVRFMHMNERQFICEECGISVRTNGSLKDHMLTHTDYAPFECEVCSKGFKSHTRLKLHMEIHDPNKHVCAECGLQLNSRATLNRHLLVHSDVMQHKCDYCGRAFKRAKALKNHLILHTGLKPYSCDFCDRTFANGSNCRSHKKKAHPDELAALEAAGGGKTFTKNIPKLETLKAVTKTADNLAPVVSKQSGRFAFGKKPKHDHDKPVEKSTNSNLFLNSANGDNYLEESLTIKNTLAIATSTIPTIDNIYSHLIKQATINDQHLDANSLTVIQHDKIQIKPHPF